MALVENNYSTTLIRLLVGSDKILHIHWVLWPIITALERLREKDPSQLGHKMRSYHKNNQKRAGKVTQVVEHLPSKCEALSSTPSTSKKTQVRCGGTCP
jgi:hypothetical protein